MDTRFKERERVLCVDDEPLILEGLRLHLGRRYDVMTASGGAAGLEDLERNGSTAVVLSDMRMPGMDGATFLGRVRQVTPDTVRILLTGQADLNACIAAVNQGQIFRFLMKPCPPNMLLENVKAAVEQYRLVTAERVLLEQTLRGSIKTLIDVLSLANPLAFGRASRIKQSANALIASLNIGAAWQIEVAAMMSQVGCVSLPAETIGKLYYGKALSAGEQNMAEKLPASAEQLLANIPRLEEVREILINQNKHFDGTGRPANRLAGEAIPLGSRILKIAIDYDWLEAQALSAPMALDRMRSRSGWYDPRLLETFATLHGGQAQKTLRTIRGVLKELPLEMVEVGMTFAEDLRTEDGALLVARGYEVTESLVERIRNFSPEVARQRIRIITKVLPPKIQALN
jgi:response regulator RpfG family c-di-GMP phosphodiesterase